MLKGLLLLLISNFRYYHLIVYCRRHCRLRFFSCFIIVVFIVLLLFTHCFLLFSFPLPLSAHGINIIVAVNSIRFDSILMEFFLCLLGFCFVCWSLVSWCLDMFFFTYFLFFCHLSFALSLSPFHTTLLSTPTIYFYTTLLLCCSCCCCCCCCFYLFTHFYLFIYMCIHIHKVDIKRKIARERAKGNRETCTCT